jgi:hypothetical protein
LIPVPARPTIRVKKGVTNYLGVGSVVGTGVGANNFLGVHSGVDFLLSVFFVLHTIPAISIHDKDEKERD